MYLVEAEDLLDNLVFSINSVFPIFILIALGYGLKRIKMLNDNFVDVATKFSFRISLPIMLFLDTATSNVEEAFDVSFSIYLVVFIVSSFVIMALITSLIVKDRQKASAIAHTACRSNCALVGMPMVISIMGVENSSIGALALLFIIPCYNIMAVVILSVFADRQTQKVSVGKVAKNIATNPLIIGTLLGILFAVLDIRLPEFLNSSLNMIGDTGTPIILIAIGYQLNAQAMRNNFKYTSVISLIKLVVIPVLALMGALLLGFSTEQACVFFILACTPTSVSSYIMAKEMGSDAQLTSQAIIVTTAVSIVTIFLGVFILRNLGMI